MDLKQKLKYRKYIQKILYNYEIQLQKKLFYFSLFRLNIFSQYYDGRQNMMKLISPCVNYLSDVREKSGTRKYLIFNLYRTINYKYDLWISHW